VFGGLAERQFGSLEGQPMMTWHTGDAVSGASYGHLGGLERSVVGCGKATVLREGRNRRIRKIAGNKATDFVQLLTAGRVLVNLIVLKQFLPTH
jgi:hypothetical protein